VVEIEPEATIENQTMGSCIEEGLQSSQLLVSEENGHNRFYEGMTAHAKGSSSRLPTAKLTR
jgi:hypothetical protein